MAQTCQQCGNEMKGSATTCAVCSTPVTGKIPANYHTHTDGQCSWSNSNTSDSRCQVNSLHFLCDWHQMNAVGSQAPRSPTDRELFDEWLDTLDKDHGWLKVDKEELWKRLQGQT